MGPARKLDIQVVSRLRADARLLGGKNHSTVLASCRKWHGLVSHGAEIRWTDRHGTHCLPAEALLELFRGRLRR